MLRTVKLHTQVAGRRFASSASSSSKSANFSNKFNFNINPPPVHEYWNARNASVLIGFVPLYFAVGYVSKYIGTHIGGFDGLLEFADSDKSPMKEFEFAQPQK